MTAMALQCELEEDGVTDAPTRRPPTYPTGRRHPKGHHRVDSRPQRAHLQIAADRLREAGTRLNDPAYAESAGQVEAFLLPGAWTALRAESGQGKPRAGDTQTVTVEVPSEAIKQALLKAAPEKDAESLSKVAEEGYQAFLKGRWMPPRKMQAPPGSKNARIVVNLTIDKELRRQVRELLPVRSQEAGYRIYEATIALYWLTEEFGIDLQAEETFVLYVRHPLKGFLEEQVAARGTSLDAEIAAGIREITGGGFVPPRPSWRKYGPFSNDAREKLHVRVPESVGSELEDLASSLSGQLGFRFSPQTLAVEILRHRLGEPEL
ncbi:hypothetical protein [Streptomyces sp. NPDC093269]|uniref:hypothetical protein n=1 Tax=Streptomyces sp. NPDC093269 TaxID=3366038 RepID=UPI0037F5D858